ncbi:putative F-box domain-containing protein [Rosa chinensis]|uniref:Putative F-box domain-containing protein n=1 Tax=Rosa chinensis TaxID=74649 RepID=A0A2P6RLJ5_ROSCH|nr:F-box protein SKIP23 isoform X2 [Rosa chinensis]XP_024181370.1 F-box protein SKIP23 isoform X2 [Rosa chinensis]XP_040369640.1 F-box protein SKIP23 isoform X2 [Rosa chinensis]XP_040369641.1 F-box protein SKIP23 isoform X2 [Rosa chinensis]XP_040369642.1 F-box protein SKIP23 isoform X2 [Rosa chinensis]PRQ47295.1 putative F-box domain-containing protein [Rosa chinensis]
MTERQKSDTCGNQRGECWSDLPVELLQSIAKRLDTKIDVSRSRAVCKSWRFSIPPLTVNSPPIKVHLGNVIRRGVRLVKKTTLGMRVVYHVAPQPPASNSRGWLVKVTEGEAPLDKTHIMLHPLSGTPFPKNPVANPLLPKELNFYDFRVSELSRTYHTPYTFPVAVSLNSDCPALMMIVEGKLYHCKLGVDGEIPKCKEIESLISSIKYVDVICHEGKFYVVSVDGRTVVVDSSLTAKMIATPISAPVIPRSVPACIRKRYLVESFGELLLVIYLATTTECRHLSELGVTFEIFKLNAAEKQWVEMATLDDRILFVGEDSCFSVLARDFPGCKGNCIYFYDPCSRRCKYRSQPRIFSNIGVFDIDGGGSNRSPRVYFLDDGDDSANIFCLPQDLALA